MNLLELQVLAVVSRMPNGNDAPPEFLVDGVHSYPPPPVAGGDNQPARPASDFISAGQSA